MKEDSAAREPEFASAYDKLTSETAQLEESVSILFKVFDLALRQEPEQTDKAAIAGDGILSDREYSSPLARKIDEQARNIRSANKKIRSLINRGEL